MRTVLLVSADESFRSRLLRALGDRSVFTASTDEEALKTLRITEVEVPLAHRATGTDWRAQLHRARQFADVSRALVRRL